MPYAAWIPMPIIAAVLLVVAYNMSEWRSFVKIFGSRKIIDILALVVTFVLTVVFNLVVAIVAGMVLYYLMLLISRLAKKKQSAEEK